MKMNRWIAASLLLPCVAFAQGINRPLIQTLVDAVSRDSLVRVITDLQGYGTRYELSPQQDSAGVYLEREMRRRGAAVERQSYLFGLPALRSVDLLDASTAWAVGGDSAIVRTTDAGQTWTSQKSVAGASYYGVDFVNSRVGWAVGSGALIVKTTDGGSTWVRQTPDTSVALNDVVALDEQSAVAVGASGVILRTTNGGQQWQRRITGVGQALNEIEARDATNLWVVGAGGTILASTDAGAGWTPRTSGTTSSLTDIHFANGRLGWIVLANSLLKSTNGGSSWTGVAAPVGSSTCRSLRFADSTTGVLVDGAQNIFRTTNGGSSWSKVYDPAASGWVKGWTPALTEVRSAGRLTAVGSRGTILTSTDNGAAWTSQTANLPAALIHVSHNIVGTIPGSATPDKEVVLVAHYDSYSNNLMVSAPGANDNASGTAAVLEGLRVCLPYRFACTLRFVAVSGEELGMYGSQHYVARVVSEGRNIVAAVNADMIGYPTTADTARLVASSYLTRNWLLDSSVVYSQRYGLGLTAVTLVDNTGASDYGPFAVAGYPTLDIAEGTANEIWGGADPYYHKTTDTIDKLKVSLVRKGAQWMLATALEQANPLGPVSVEPG